MIKYEKPNKILPFKKPSSMAERVLNNNLSTLYIVKEIVDLDDFKTEMWVAIQVARNKARSFEAALGSEEILVENYGKVLKRSDQPIDINEISASILKDDQESVSGFL